MAGYVGLDLVGVKAHHPLKDRLFITATSFLAMSAMVGGLKWAIDEPRPDNPSEHDAFPSGHTARAFMGAELVRREYGLYPALGAYSVAGVVAFMRLYNNRHWANDVLAGAGIGILSANIGYWLMPLHRRLFRTERWGRRRPIFARATARNPVIAIVPTYDYTTCSFGGAISIGL